MQWQYFNAVSVYILYTQIFYYIHISDVDRYVPVNEEPERVHLRGLQKYYTQQQDPRDKKLIKEWIFRLALHLKWNRDTFLEPFVESSDEESESGEEEIIPEVIIPDSADFLLDDHMPLKGMYVDMDSKLVDEQNDVVQYGHDDTEFLFDKDA